MKPHPSLMINDDISTRLIEFKKFNAKIARDPLACHSLNTLFPILGVT